MMSGSTGTETVHPRPRESAMKALHRTALILPLLALGLAGAPATAQHQQAQARGGFSFLDYRAPVPKAWEPQVPGSSMRAAQYRVPAAAGASDGELIVFYFGKGQGGTVQANVERWASQFATPEGKAVAPLLSRFTTNGLAVTTVELSGSYARGVGTGPQGTARPDQTLLVAVIEAPEGNITIQLHGDAKTVAAHRKGFDAMVRGFGKRS
jgi:hypothetical protein